MKLRALVIVLLLLNLLLFAKGQGWLGLWGISSGAENLSAAQQEELNPEHLQISLNSKDQLFSQNSNPTVCLQSPQLQPQLAQRVQTELARDLPAGSWTTEAIQTPGQWMLYLGRFPNVAALNKQKAELRRLRISNFKDAPPGYQLGLSLAFYDDANQAKSGLDILQKRGLKAQIITLAEPLDVVRIRLPMADERARTTLLRLRPILPNQEFAPCQD